VAASIEKNLTKAWDILKKDYQERNSLDKLGDERRCAARYGRQFRKAAVMRSVFPEVRLPLLDQRGGPRQQLGLFRVWVVD
jgi:hypothetical protein